MSNKHRRFPRVWIVSGPSGSGKTTLCEALLRDRFWKKRLLKSVSFTTRKLRAGEKQGRDYRAISQEQFVRLLKRKAFLEHEKIFGFYYGTPKAVLDEALRKNKDLLLSIDVRGAQTVRKFLGKSAVSIFILPPKLKTLSERLKSRSTESKIDIATRLRRVKIELSYVKKYDYVVVNDDFDEALKKLKAIIGKGKE
jgi:guanylate kinase